MRLPRLWQRGTNNAHRGINRLEDISSKENEVARSKKQSAEEITAPPMPSPVWLPSNRLHDDLLRVKEIMDNNVIGQPEVIEEMLNTLSLYYAKFNPGNRPICSSLLLGNTGMGKTLAVEALALALHGSERMLTKIDCGEFISEHESAKLIGAPPGYLGHRETHPLLSQEILNAATTLSCPISIVLFDEIEKAAHSVQRLLLNILDKGFLTLGDNRKVNFQSSLIFFTSNLGLKELARSYDAGYGLNVLPTVSTGSATASARLAASKHFNPELYNRIDKTIVFKNLRREDYRKILYLELKKLQMLLLERLGTRTFYFDIDDDVENFLLNEGCNDKWGARELKRVINKHLILPLANVCNSGSVESGQLVKCMMDGNEVKFTK